jgi:cytochrome c6
MRSSNRKDIDMTGKRSCLSAALLLALVLSCATCFGADTINGAKLYAIHCVSCHGKKGDGIMPGTPNFSRGNSLLQPDGALLERIKQGKNAMPGYYGILKEREILDIVAHLRTFN